MRILSIRETALPRLMALLRNADLWDTSNVLFESGIIIEYDILKPRPDKQYIDYGMTVLSAGVFDSCLPDEAFDLAILHHGRSTLGLLGGFEVFDPI